jgi:hypothetical protein
MFCKNGISKFFCTLGLYVSAGVFSVFGAGLKTLPGHVLAVTSRLQTLGDLPATNQLRLAIGLPLRDAAGLETFLAGVYDPASPHFRAFLTPEEFTARFGPTEQDYTMVKAFARANGFKITGTHGNRLLLDVQADVADIQRAFHISLRKFSHPTEARDFFAPDREPTVDVSLPVADVSGLNNYQLPHPKLIRQNFLSAGTVPRSGSGAGGTYIGDDFRAAYVPGTSLTGAGQMVGLVQFDNYYTNDISAYANLAGGGRKNIPIQTVLIDGYDGTPTPSGNGEVALDIQMAMAMAPGLAKIIVFTGGPNGMQNDILNRMAASNSVKNLSCSWGWSGGPDVTTDAIFQQMAAQGQSFFSASGDSDAFTLGASSVNAVDNPSIANAPSSSPYITQVGGTTLTTSGAGGAWSSETVWNWGGGSGSSGGISTHYSIPAWQANVSMTANQGSTTKRNIPDVALTADHVFSCSDNGQKGPVGGTSCAAPLWSGFMALVNQQATALGKPGIGFINPAIYGIGAGGSYPQLLHDITSGNNTWSGSPNAFFAVSGYDLCTGWGTPAGNNLIDALVGLGDSLGIISTQNFSAAGATGGPFAPLNPVITVTNSGNASLAWALANPNVVSWLTAAPAGGVLASNAATDVVLTFTSAATNLAIGSYTANFKFTNQTSGTVQFVPFHLQVLPVLAVQPTNALLISGPVGGPFFPDSQDFSIVNRGAASAGWKVTESSAWLAVNQTTGLVSGASSADFTVSLTTNANRLKAGIYKSIVTVYNQKKKVVQKLPFTLSIGQNLVVNGGFETGNFKGWTLNAVTTVVTNLAAFVHTGGHGAALGQASTLGYLSQTLPTSAGQTYLLSLWLKNPQNNNNSGTPNEFVVQWEGTTLYDQTDLPFFGWTNLQFFVTATNSGSLLQIGFRDDPYYLALDDISLKPVVAPHIRAIVQSPATFHFTFAADPGSVYQVQYKTDLAQPDWIDLGDPVTADTNGLTVSDDNVANFPQKFYRLKLVR